MTLHSIVFVHPLWLLVGVVAAVGVIALGVRVDWQRRRALAQFSSRRHNGSTLSLTLRRGKRALVALGLLAACVALARPQKGFRWEQAQRRGIDVLFALDTSKSMLAPDLLPTRLARAKLAISDLVTKFEGDRVGLVAFAGDAFLQCPLTLDRDMFNQTLDAVDTSIIPRGGTDVGRAIEVAVEALHNEPANHKIVVFLTDGEDLQARAIAAAKAAAQAGVHIYTVGVGTAAGELIPLPGGGFLHDQAGAFVRSRLDDTTLQTMAQVSGGAYRRLGADGQGLNALYNDVLAKVPPELLGSRMRQIPLEQFQWPLLLAILCLGVEPLIRERRLRWRRRVDAPMKPERRRTFAVFRKRTTQVAAAAVLVLGSSAARASSGDAERDYQAKHYDQAAKEYRQLADRAPTNAQLQYNAGTAAYKAGDWANAKAAFERGLHSERVELQQKDYYDLGNTLYRNGQKLLGSAPEKISEQTIEQWKSAIASYESAIKLDGKDADAIFNRDFVKRKLAELEQKKKQQDQKDQKNQDQKKQNQQAQNQPQPGKSGKSGQNGQPQNQQAQNQPQPGKSGQNGQPQNQQAQNQPQPGKSGQSGQPQNQQAQDQPAEAKPGPANQPKAQPGQETQPESPDGDDKAPAGTLSRRDAKALLDASRSDERILPSAPLAQKQPPATDEPVAKDW